VSEILAVVVGRDEATRRQLPREIAAGQAGKNQREGIDQREVGRGERPAVLGQAKRVEVGEALMQVGLSPLGRRFLELISERGAVIGLKDNQSTGIGLHNLLQQRLRLRVHAFELLDEGRPGQGIPTLHLRA
jgi:hypothetical protein